MVKFRLRSVNCRDNDSIVVSDQRGAKSFTEMRTDPVMVRLFVQYSGELYGFLLDFVRVVEKFEEMSNAFLKKVCSSVLD